MDSKIIYENTYIMDPDPMMKLHRPPIRRILKDVMRIQFERWEYLGLEAARKCEDCSAMAYNRIVPIVPPRYKLCIQTFIVQKHGQGVRLATRSLWATDTDNLVTENWSSKTFEAVCLIFYTYNE